MVYRINNNFDKWIEKTQLYFFIRTICSVPIAIFTAYAIFLGSNSNSYSDAKFGIAGVIVILLFFFFAYFRAGSIFNRTIKEIEINEFGLVITTYKFKIFGIFAILGKYIKYDYKELKFFLNEFPLKQTSKNATIECYILVIKEVEYYLIYKEFGDSLISDLFLKTNN
ncbi:hypothetical protein [Flavobacterium ginsenosidimutans]|uniref:hypothetical protein n=1 Tax=Flavobacterium ginsenosidimutans TaxID=687844 RepID=UPI000DAC2ACB|nr:hypothetical protein [Flavobacterium ginsenosidimutans]KAF2338821.1 hypothetical protein DM444_00890 [Flavobacterium ginsenosidimutans]